MDVTVFSGADVRVIPVAAVDGHRESADLVTVLHTPLLNMPRTFSATQIPFGSSTCSIAFPPRMTLLPRPRPGSRGSRALYWIVYPRPTKRELFLLQYLPPDACTSIHSHTHEDEDFFCLHGACEVLTGQRQPRWTTAKLDQRIPLGSSPETRRGTTVPRDIVHQLQTTKLPALNVIVIRKTSARTLEDLKHDPARWV